MCIVVEDGDAVDARLPAAVRDIALIPGHYPFFRDSVRICLVPCGRTESTTAQLKFLPHAMGLVKIMVQYACLLRIPFIYGGTPESERARILGTFRVNPLVNCIGLSKVGDTSIDIPEANVIIQVSFAGFVVLQAHLMCRFQFGALAVVVVMNVPSPL